MALPDGSAMVLSRRIEVLQTSLATIWGFECSRGGRKSGPASGWPSPTPRPETWRSMSATIRWRSGAGAAGIEAALGLGGRPFQYMNQVHGNEVAGIGAAAAAGAVLTPRPADAPTADAMVSLGEPLAVMVADCVPVVLVGDRAGGEAPVLAVVHAGRPGVASGVVPAAVARMRELGAAAAQRLDRPVRLRTLLRGPRGHARRRGRPRARRLVHHLPRHAGPGPAGRRPQPAAGRGRRASNTPATAPWKTRACSPTAATRHRTVRRTGVDAGPAWTSGRPPDEQQPESPEPAAAAARSPAGTAPGAARRRPAAD